jgi:hypothetical protein
MSFVVSIAWAATAWAETTPGVVSGSATSVTNIGALLHGTVNPQGGYTAYAFEYGLTAAYGSATTTHQAGRGTKAVSVKATLANLTPGTVYHYRIIATNKLGTAAGLDRTFTTTGHPPPGAVTGVASAVGKTTATLTGTVVTQSETTGWIFQYGTTTAYGLQSTMGLATASPTPTPVAFTLTGLSPGTTFHYRLVAEHDGIVVEDGIDETFTTIPLTRLHSRVTAHTTPFHARHKPYRFTTIGKVAPPASLPAGVACTGVVDVRFLLGRKSVALRRPSLGTNCTFSTQVLFRHLIDHTKTQLRVEVRFRGNSYLGSTGARTQTVRLG